MDFFSPTGTMGLQSGFVLAAVLLAFFFAERLGGSGQLAERSFQVALGLTLTLLAVSATSAFVRPSSDGTELPAAFFEEQPFQDEEQLALFQDAGREAARDAADARTIHAGLGLVFAITSLLLLSRWRVLPHGLMLAGLLLLLFGGPAEQGGVNDLTSFMDTFLGALLPGGSSDAGQARATAHFATLLAGAAGLLAFGFSRWERGAAGGRSA
jgi:hypothetical protein